MSLPVVRPEAEKGQFGIFAKYWQPGTVKTRLAASIGAEAAARVHRACLETLLGRFAGIAGRCVLAFTPFERRAEFANVAGEQWALEPQESGDLGRRITRHFALAFAGGAAPVVLIGSDSPTLPAALVLEAFDRLTTGADAVFGPTDDGGYYLVGLSRPMFELFEGIAWGTSDVWPQTIERAAGCRYDVLARWYDIDTHADLARLHDELANNVDAQFADLWQVLRDIYREDAT